MGERKVINKYYPPDFDPSKIPRKKRPKNDQIKVRMMLPMSIRCNTCSEYLYKGKKFNARKETVIGEEYLSIKIFRFYIRCTRCSAEITIKTDPQNSDYQCEFGASRNFEPWREKEKLIEEVKKQREQEEQGDAMKALENRTIDNKMEIDILDALDEIRSLNAAQSKIDPERVLMQRLAELESKDRQLDEQDEEEIRSIYGGGLAGAYIKRIDEYDDDDDDPWSDPSDDEKEEGYVIGEDGIKIKLKMENMSVNENNLPLHANKKIRDSPKIPDIVKAETAKSPPEPNVVKPAPKPKSILGVKIIVKKKEEASPATPTATATATPTLASPAPPKPAVIPKATVTVTAKVERETTVEREPSSKNTHAAQSNAKVETTIDGDPTVVLSLLGYSSDDE